ncbi:MAG: peptidase S41 [Bacteroidetes bacterium]|nr:peptidase S41 [Bacteroidota bacterium]MBS1973347.1 peptidase S41 [Bacteroidota bacterium]
MKTNICLLFIVLFFLSVSCQTSRESFNPAKKYSPEKLKADYKLFREILEESHPGLYWYTPKNSMDSFFDYGYSQIKDSMTEPQFRVLLTYVITHLDCGHTTVKYSKKYTEYLDTARLKLFPFAMKFWGDTMIVTANINRKDSFIKRGTVIKSINGLTAPQLRDTMFHYMATDGYSLSGKYQSLSNGFNFGSWYKSLFGLGQNLNIDYYDRAGNEKQVMAHIYDPVTDTLRADSSSKKAGFAFMKKYGRDLQLYNARNLQMDTVGSTAFMTLNTFSHGNRLKHFFRKSFHTMDKKRINNLIIDLRSNGGGETGNSILLTRFIIDKKFKMADSLYALTRHSRYDKYIGKSFFYQMLMVFLTSKRSDGKYHFGYFERHYFHPKHNHHFDGNVYLLIGGNSFSATTLFAGALKGQKNVTLIGEETGGGYYGNNAWMIPDVTLPNTGLRFRLPKFRLVVDKNRKKNGRGVMPDVVALPTTEAIRNGIDFKTEKALEIIQKKLQPSNASEKQE